jgi:hypothetical protein
MYHSQSFLLHRLRVSYLIPLLFYFVTYIRFATVLSDYNRLDIFRSNSVVSTAPTEILSDYNRLWAPSTPKFISRQAKQL